MAVDQSRQKSGIGSGLLGFVFALAVEMSKSLGCIGVVVDAKPDARKFYARFGFAALDALEGRLRESPQPIPMSLHIRTITDALGK